MTLVISNLAKRFGERTLFGDLNLNILPGRFVGVAGANGAGKSTLLRIIAGLEQANSGSMRFGAPQSRELRRQDALYFPQRHHALELTGVELWRTLRSSLSGFSPSPDQDKQWIDEAPSHLQDHTRMPLDRLSLGQQRAVQFYVFARQERAVMLFDEPFAGLSNRSVEMLLGLFTLVRDRYVLVVDHRRSALETLCDAIIDL